MPLVRQLVMLVSLIAEVNAALVEVILVPAAVTKLKRPVRARLVLVTLLAVSEVIVVVASVVVPVKVFNPVSV